jgi:hypothetical protein
MEPHQTHQTHQPHQTHQQHQQHQPQVVQILPIDHNIQEAPKKTRRPQPPIYNRSSLTKPKNEQTEAEIAELKKLIRKQEEQLRLLSKKLKDY